jgi:hypothetical protein
MKTEAWHRRQAIQIAAQLPENGEDALIVLELAREFLYPPQRPETPGGARERGVVVSISKPAG